MKLQDYLHYYMGCKVEKDSDALDYPTIKGIHGDRVMISEYRYKTPHAEGIFTRPEMYQYEGFVKPLLRRLEDMTEEEIREYGKLVELRTDGVHSVYISCDTPESYHYLLQQHFDLFGLIPAGLAIDIKTLNT